MLFCPYRGIEIHETDGSKEHVVPESLGGTNQLSITVQRAANNQLGTDVDGPVGDQLFGFHREQFNLKGHSGRTPRFEVPFSAPALGGHRGTWTPGAGKDAVSLRPKVTREPTPDGKTKITVAGNVEEAKRIVEEMKAAYAAKGRAMETVEEVVQKVEKPQIDAEFVVDMLALSRFYAKLAIGIGHWLWGETWSRDAVASLLREILWAQSLEQVQKNGVEGGSIKPAGLGLQLKQSEHCFMTTAHPTNGYSLTIFLFGGDGVTFRVGKTGGVLDGCHTPESVIVDVVAGTVRRASLSDLAKEGKLKP